jgi:hypothetical protein
MTAIRPFEDLINFMAKLAPNDVLSFRPSEATIQRVRLLSKKAKEDTISEAEKIELEAYLIQEDLMIIAKARAKAELVPHPANML